MLENSQVHIAEQLIKQIENENQQSLMWLISSINRLLLTDKDFSLLEFQRIVSCICPKTRESFESIMEMKELKIVK